MKLKEKHKKSHTAKNGKIKVNLGSLLEILALSKKENPCEKFVAPKTFFFKVNKPWCKVLASVLKTMLEVHDVRLKTCQDILVRALCGCLA